MPDHSPRSVSAAGTAHDCIRPRIMPLFMSLPLAGRFGVYEVGALISTGRMGNVYRAPDVRLK